MRGTGERSPAHQTDNLAELVCSNSLRSDDDTSNAVGLLHHEMRACDSLIMAPPTRPACPQAARWPWTARSSPTPSRKR
jgi:methylenetetrahydrofolate--tRNA-(uracil-5-)-methyltransferase